MPIYTRTGDGGETDLLGGIRVPKDAALLEVCGDLDELGALLGVARCEAPAGECNALLEQVQRRLFHIGSELVAVASGRVAAAAIGSAEVAAIEQVIDRHESALESARTFILPAGCGTAAMLHLARAVCRRAERRLVALARSRSQAVSPGALIYMNRLSDLLYVLARAANAQAGVAETAC
jgi:cob(I)alamin adenosyltransferase